MKTIKTFFVILTLIGFSTNSFAQGGLLGKAKEAAAKSKDSKTVKVKKSKGKDDMAVKSTGVPASATSTKTVPTNTVTPTNK